MAAIISLRTRAESAIQPVSTPASGVPNTSAISLPPYLAQRNGMFYFKRKVPTALMAAFGNRAQIWKSLETTNLRDACRRLAEEVRAFNLRIDAYCAGQTIVEAAEARPGKTIELTADMIPELLKRHEAQMLQADDDELHEMRPLRAADLAERRAQIDEFLEYYRLARVCDDTSAVEETVDQLLAGEGLHARPRSDLRQQLCVAMLEREVSILQEQRARLDGKKQATPSIPLPVRLQPTLSDYLKVWEDSAVRPLRTIAMARHSVDRWIGLMGEQAAAYIKRADVKVFRDRLLAMNLSASTVRNRLGLLRAIVGCYHDEMDIQGRPNPFQGIRVQDRGQHVRTKKERRAFEISELNHLYSDAVFTEKRLPRGQCGEAAYWLPLLGPFVGARIEELAQMNTSDVELINGVWTLRICDLDSETQQLKTVSSFRRVPIHEELIKLGFLCYVSKQKRAGHKKLFHTLEAQNKHKAYSNAVGKWFGRLIDGKGLNSPQLDYHSFRYLFKQRLTQCGVNLEVRDALCGHWGGKDSAGKVYLRRDNRQYDFHLLCEGIRKLRYDELSLTHLYVADPFDGVDVELFTGRVWKQ